MKIFVSSDGMYRVTAAALEAAQVDVMEIDPATLQLFRNDQEIAVRVLGAGSTVTLDFFGEASDSPYSAFNVYRLAWGTQTGKRIRERASGSASGAVNRTFLDKMHLTRPTLFIPQPGDPGKSWFWQALTAPTTTTIPITLSEAIPDQAQLRINVHGSSQEPVNPDHHLRVFFNNVRVADQGWDGQGARAIDAAIPANVIRPGENTLQLVAPGDTHAAADVVLLRSIDITYTRRLAVGSGALEFRAGMGSYQVEGLDGKSVELFDITDPHEPVRLSDAGGTASSVVVNVMDGEQRRWLALPSSGYRAADRIAPMPRTDVRQRARQADYVIITHPDFVDAVQPLAQWRTKRGLRVAVATTDEIYDEFNYGGESPLALRAFLDSVKPRFALLVGKASYDYRDYLNGPNENLVPTFLVETLHLNQAASDDWFAADSLLQYPSFAVGRIPAKTKEQVASVVAKVIAYESQAPGADWRTRGIFIADDEEETFVSLSNSLAAKTKGRISADQIYLNAYRRNTDAARADIISRWNQGAFLLTYVGHGSLDTWAEGPLFASENVRQLRNGERLPILFTPTCLDGLFYHPFQDSLAEELLFANHGGVIAGVAPTGLSIPEAQGELMEALFGAIFENVKPTLGEGLVNAKRKLDLNFADSREVIQTFVLLGDPALEIPSY